MVELFDESEKTKEDRKKANEGTYIALSALVFLLSGFFAVGSMAGGVLQSTQQLSLYVQSIIIPLSVIEAYGIYKRRYWSIPYGAVLTLVNVFGAVRFGLFALFVSIALVSALSYLIKNKNIFSSGRKDFVIVVILLLLTGVYFLPLNFLKDERELLDRYREISREASNLKNPEICEGIDTESYKDDCLMSVYMSIRNVSLCSNFKNERLRRKCNDDIIGRIAWETHNTSMCSLIIEETYREYCIKNNEKWCRDMGGYAC